MKIDNSSINNSAGITSKIYDEYFPDGQIIITGTSSAKEGISSRTLTSRTISDIQTGDALYRSPKFSQSFFTRTIDSSLNSLVTGGAESVYNSPALISINNPEDASLELVEGQTELTKTQITGGIAFNRIMAETVLSRKGSADFIDNATRLALTEMSNSQNANPNYIAGLAHGNNPYEVIGTTITTGYRTIVLESSITPEEKGWILDRGNKLKSLNVVEDSTFLTGGFSFDVQDGLKNLKQTETFYPSMQPNSTVEQSLVDAAAQTAYVCPALIELLIFLHSKLDYRGRIGAGVAKSAQSITFGSLSDNGSVNDHVFGRGFDITYIASKPPATEEIAVDLLTQGTDLARYRSALDHFLSVLSVAPNALLPDLIVVHPDLSAELGIVSGNEPVSSAVKTKYPKLVNVNFQSDSNHRTNIHISFSAQRSGQYTGPNGVLGTSGQFLVPVTGDGALSSVPAGIAPVLGEKFRRNFGTTTGESLTTQEIFDLLRGTIMSDEAAAIFVAVAVRESGSRPAAFNPAVTRKNDGTYGGDWSVGMFQMNLKTDAHGSKTMALPFGPTGSVVTKKGWQFGYKNFAQDRITETSFNSSMYSKYRALRDQPAKTYNQVVTELFPSVDPIVWIPFNQASMLYTVITGNPCPLPFTSATKIGGTAESGYIFSPWGDYGGGPPYGFISNVRFKDALDVYATTGKDKLLLKRWTITMFNGSPAARESKSYSYANNWVNGWFYPVTYSSSSGWTAGTPTQMDDDLYAGSTGSGGTSGGGTGGDRPGGSGLSTGSPLLAKLATAREWALRQIGCPYAAINPYRVGSPPWPYPPDNDNLPGFREGLFYTFPGGTIVYDCSGFVVAFWRQLGINFPSQYGIGSSQQFDDDRIPDAPVGNYQFGDIAVYYPNPNVGHVVLIWEKNSDGSYTTIEATPSRGVSTYYKLQTDPSRLRAVKRPIIP